VFLGVFVRVNALNGDGRSGGSQFAAQAEEAADVLDDRVEIGARAHESVGVAADGVEAEGDRPETRADEAGRQLFREECGVGVEGGGETALGEDVGDFGEVWVDQGFTREPEADLLGSVMDLGGEFPGEFGRHHAVGAGDASGAGGAHGAAQVAGAGGFEEDVDGAVG